MIVVGCADGSVQTWDGGSSSQALPRNAGGGDDELLAMVTAVPDVTQRLSWTRVAAGDMAGAVRVWVVKTRSANGYDDDDGDGGVDLVFCARLATHANAVNWMTLANNDSSLVFTASRDGTLCAIDLLGGCATVHSTTTTSFTAHNDRPNESCTTNAVFGTAAQPAVANSSARLQGNSEALRPSVGLADFVATQHGGLAGRETEFHSSQADGDHSNPMVLRRYRGHRDTVRTCVVADGGAMLLSGGKSGAVVCHDVATGRMLWESDGHTDYINCAAVGCDVSASAGSLDCGTPSKFCPLRFFFYC
jgi:WD40 repeat protein